LDLLLFAWENKIPLEAICSVMELTEEQVKRAFRDFTAKAHASRHARKMPPTLKADNSK
jgi:NAD+ synthase